MAFYELPRLSTTDTGAVLAHAVTRMAKHLRRKGLLMEAHDAEQEDNELAALTASAVSGASPPAGPEFRRGALPLAHAPRVHALTSASPDREGRDL